MTAIVYIRRLTALLVSSLILFMLLGCGGSGGDGNGAAANSSRLALTLTVENEAPSPPQPKIVSAVRAVPGDPDFVTSLEITVRADDIDPPITEFVALRDDQNTATVALFVPVGKDREITAIFSNADRVPIFGGQTTVDLLEEVEKVEIVLQSLIPTITDPGPQNNVEGDEVDLQIEATSPSGLSLTYSADNLPPDLTIDSGTGLIAGTLALNTSPAGSPYDVTVTVSDGSRTAETAFTWTVVDSSLISTITDPGPQNNLEGDEIDLQIEATSPIGLSLTYSADNLPPDLTIDSGTGLIAGTLALNTSPAGSPYDVTVTVSDGLRPAETAFTWTVDSLLGFTYVANSTSNNISGFRINSRTGALTVISGSPFFDPNVDGTDVVALAADPSGRFVYVANSTSNNISGFQINSRTGALTVISGSPFFDPNVDGTDVVALPLAVDPSGRFVYVANFTSGDISGFTIDAGTGALTVIEDSPFSDLPTEIPPNSVALAVDPSGRFVYVANNQNNDVSGFRIDAGTGALEAISPFLDGGQAPNSVTADPSGRFVYVANNQSNDVSGFTIDDSTGALTAMLGPPSSPFSDGGQAPSSVTVDPFGRFVYVANNRSNDVSGFTIDDSTGALSSITGFRFPAGTDPNSVTVDPSGRFVYVTNFTTNDISAFEIQDSDGSLVSIPGFSLISPTEEGPVAIATTRALIPTITNPGPQSNFEGDEVDLPIEATSAIGLSLTYSADNLPPDLTIDSGTGLIAGTLALNTSPAGSPYDVTVTVSDGLRTAETAFTWTAFVLGSP